MFENLVIGIYLRFGYWCLEFYDCNLLDDISKLI